MFASDSFALVMEQLRSGEDGAAQEVFRRFARQLVTLARRRFDQRLAHKVDPEDLVQSVFKSFFVRYRTGKLQADNWDVLWGLLAVITVRKCADRIEYLRAGRRDVRREVTGQEGQDGPWALALDREPLPQEAAILAETMESLFRSASIDERQVLELSLQGYTTAEVSLRLGLALRTVQRLRERIRKRLERMHENN